MDAASLQDADAGSLLRREPPLPLPVGERKGAGEKVWWHTPFLSRSVGEEGGWGEGEGGPHPQPAPALRALRWPPRLSQKYTRRDGVATDVCQQFVNRCHGSLSQKYASRDGFETRPYQRDERQPSPASAVVNPTSRFETRPYQRDERQSCGPPAPPAPLPRCGPCGGLHVCLRNTLGGTGLQPMFASSS